MKTIFTLIYFAFFLTSVNAQQASDYFPAETGYIWDYRVTTLDSQNKGIDSLVFSRKDTFAIVSNYKDKLANIVPTKTGTPQTLPFQPYIDTSFYYFDGADGYDYFSLGSLETLMAQLDSTGVASSFNFVNFFRSLQNWYPLYKFSSNVNAGYTLLSKDTTINLSGTDYHFRFEYLATRLDDENLHTAAGTFDCKKFFLEWKVSVVISPLIPPVKVLSTKDTVWIAPGKWIVQDIIPTNEINLQAYGIDPFAIPGQKMEIEGITSVKSEVINPETIHLFQNYPNPFNPSTKIIYTIPDAGISFAKLVQLKVYDVLGNEVATLVNEEKSSGTYEVEFNGKNLTSGIYFYTLKSGSFVITRKMILLK